MDMISVIWYFVDDAVLNFVVVVIGTVWMDKIGARIFGMDFYVG